MKKKLLAAVVAVALAACCVIGGTLAWLMDSAKVTNTFTVGDINITLTETTDTYKILPGTEIAKDPVVTVKGDSEACYLFVKVETNDKWNAKMTYEVAEDWKTLNGVENVYYQVVNTNKADQTFNVLKGSVANPNGVVNVADTLTKTEVEAMKGEGNAPTLTFTAYAVQKEGVNDVNAAWDLVK